MAGDLGSVDAAFLAPRMCFRPLDPALEQAAGLLSEAADALLAVDGETARRLLRDADMPALRAHAYLLMGKTNPEIHRFRAVDGAPASLVAHERAKLRRPSAAMEMAVFARDGYRCRYCGCRVVLSKARRVMSALVPGAIAWGPSDRDRHSAFYALTAVADHVVPHARGGTSDLENLVTTCQGCNYGKENYTLEELGLMDPRLRPPVCDDWDGLSRMLSVPVAVAPMAAGGAGDGSATRETAGRRPAKSSARAKVEAPAAWYAGIERSYGREAERLLAYLPTVAHLNVSWTVGKCLLVYVAVGEKKLAVLGVEPDGRVQIPWFIGDEKPRFKRFADILASGIPGAEVYETPRMWRVKKGERMVLLGELMDASAALTAGLEALGSTLATS